MWDALAGALAQAARERFGDDHPFVAACGAGDLKDLRNRLDALPRADADALLAAAHKRLREDPAALLANWPGGRAN